VALRLVSALTTAEREPHPGARLVRAGGHHGDQIAPGSALG